MYSSSSVKSPKRLLFVLILLAAGCILGTFYVWQKGLGVGYGGTTETWAHFGSFFGGVLGPLLSFFSFLGVIYTVYLQSKSNEVQAQANENTATSIESSELASKENLEEQRKQFQEQIEYDRQKQLLDMFLISSNRVDIAGCEAVKDLTTKNEKEESTLSYYYNTYNWRAKVFVIELKRLNSKLDKESAVIITPHLEKVSGQLYNYCKNGLNNPSITFTTEADVIQICTNELERYAHEIETVIGGLKDKYGIEH
ncbi:hypothetical protein [Pseudoalteromonas atlantica]|uniref:hypothetical protein n=1 Tax=Pseudoalteromonas atlantica TaxID=288 RepID=UPI003735E2D4